MHARRVCVRYAVASANCGTRAPVRATGRVRARGPQRPIGWQCRAAAYNAARQFCKFRGLKRTRDLGNLSLQSPFKSKRNMPFRSCRPLAPCRAGARSGRNTRRAPRPSSAGKRWRTRSYDGAGGVAARRVRFRRPVVAPARARARSRHRCDAVREAARYGGWEAHRTPEPEPEQTSSPGQARSTRGARCRASSRSRRAGGCHTPAKGS